MDEMELVRKAKSGDTAAFEILVRQYWTKAYRLAESIVGETDAEDVTVEAFVQAWQSLPKFREQSSFGTWLFRIVLNQAKQWQRKTACIRFEAIEELESECEGESFSLRDIESMVCEQDWKRQVQSSVQKLPEHLRLPLILRFWDELSYPEIAQVLGIKENTARMRVVAALKLLAKMLGVSERSDRRRPS